MHYSVRGAHRRFEFALPGMTPMRKATPKTSYRSPTAGSPHMVSGNHPWVGPRVPDFDFWEADGVASGIFDVCALC
jgi:hypothetical protein